MMMDVKLPVYVLIIICALVGPGKESVNYFIDGIELSEDGDIDSIRGMPQKNGKTTKFYEYKEEGDIEFGFSMEQMDKDPLLYTFKADVGDPIEIQISEYLSEEDIAHLKANKESRIELDMGEKGGKVTIVKIGTIIYVKADAYNDMIFAVHE
jgi:hypothetical protein